MEASGRQDGGLKLTEAGRRDRASGLVLRRGHSQPSPTFSLWFWIFLLFFILIFLFPEENGLQ